MSVYRISSNTIPDSSMFHNRAREYSLDKNNEQINSGKKHRLPRENVVDVTQAMTFHTKIHGVNQFIRNIDDLSSERSLVEVKLTDTVNVMQRLRELTVQSANGIYDSDDRKKMAMEVDQLLRNIVLNGNSKFKGNFLFSGFKKYTKPFEVLEGSVRGIKDAMITEVRYLGDNGKHKRAIDANEFAAATNSGNEVFWAEPFQIYSQVNTADFRLTDDSKIMINGEEIKFDAGDNIYAIVEKINQSPVAVKASIDVINGGLILESTVPHKPEIADIEGGTLMQDLGILEEGMAIGPDNFNQDATQFGGSIFDVLIGLRDAMLQNNQEDIGGRYLGAIDNTINSLTFYTAESGALQNRLDYLTDRHGSDKLRYTETLSQLEDVDYTEAITELKQLEFAQKAALSSLARITKTSLMDFLR